jgi:hypothetical protein
LIYLWRKIYHHYEKISVYSILPDGLLRHSATIVTKAQLLQLKSLIRELQPNCLVNSRLGLSVEEDAEFLSGFQVILYVRPSKEAVLCGFLYKTDHFS